MDNGEGAEWCTPNDGFAPTQEVHHQMHAWAIHRHVLLYHNLHFAQFDANGYTRRGGTTQALSRTIDPTPHNRPMGRELDRKYLDLLPPRPYPVLLWPSWRSEASTGWLPWGGGWWSEVLVFRRLCMEQDPPIISGTLLEKWSSMESKCLRF